MDDNEINEIREKRMTELKEKMEHQRTTGSVIQVDQLHISDILQKHPALVIDFWAEWCGPCQRVGPAIEELAQEFAGKVTFAKCNTDENQQLRFAAQYFSDPKHRLLLAREDGGPGDRGVPQGSDPGKSAPEFPVTGKNQECACEKIFFYRLFAVGIVCPLFVDFLCRPSAAVVAGPVRLAPGLCMFFLILCRIEVLTGRLLRLLLLRRAGLRVLAIRPVTVIGSPVVVFPGGLFLMRLLIHRYQLSYGSGYRKNLLFPARWSCAPDCGRSGNVCPGMSMGAGLSIPRFTGCHPGSR